MKRFFLVVLFPLLVLAGLYFGGTYVYENRLYAPISDRISDETKQKLRDTILVFQAKAELEREVADLERQLEHTKEVQELFEVALRNNPNLPESLPFYKVSDQMLETDRDRFAITSYETPFIPLSHFGRRAYLEVYKGDLLLITAMGTVGRVPLTEIAGDGFDMPTVHTNLHALIPNPEFYEVNQFSIKDVLVQENQLLLSYSKALRPGCYTLAIAAADLSSSDLTFEDIFIPDECVAEDNDYGIFQPNQTGGRMLPLGPGWLLFSTGEWGVHPLAQDPESLFGKVVAIDLSSGDVDVISMGHRNPQGLYHDPAASLIVVAEHGPSGGDEININRSPGGKPENYGWPVSSYGEHYSNDPKVYAAAPLHKSHADYGFIEPDLNFKESISPSAVVRMSPDPRDPDRYALMMGTMGFDYTEGDESLHIFDLDKDFKIVSQERIILDDRVRDMIALPETGHYALFLEGDTYEFGTIALVIVNP
jgi:hypothetical protein